MAPPADDTPEWAKKLVKELDELAKVQKSQRKLLETRITLTETRVEKIDKRMEKLEKQNSALEVELDHFHNQYRKKNIIIYGYKPKKSEITIDLNDFVTSFLKEKINMNVEVTRVLSIGKDDKKKGQPLLVTLPNETV